MSAAFGSSIESGFAVYFTDPTIALPPLRNGRPIPGFARELPFAGIFNVCPGWIVLPPPGSGWSREI